MNIKSTRILLGLRRASPKIQSKSDTQKTNLEQKPETEKKMKSILEDAYKRRKEDKNLTDEEKERMEWLYNTYHKVWITEQIEREKKINIRIRMREAAIQALPSVQQKSARTKDTVRWDSDAPVPSSVLPSKKAVLRLYHLID